LDRLRTLGKEQLAADVEKLAAQLEDAARAKRESTWKSKQVEASTGLKAASDIGARLVASLKEKGFDDEAEEVQKSLSLRDA